MAREPEQPQGDSVKFAEFAGLRNTVTRERLGPGDLEIALNVDLDNANQMHRRRGYTKVANGAYHSLYRVADGALYGAKDGVLGVIYPNYTFQSLGTPSGDAPIAYVQVGGTLYYSSEDVSGKIDLVFRTVAPWGDVDSANVWHSPVVNPTDTLAPIRGKLLGKPPMATSLAEMNGRIYLANKNVLWATELYAYDFVDKTRNYIMYEADVTALAPVTDGMYVSTESAIYFQDGPFGKMRRTGVCAFGALPGSMVYVRPDQLPNEIGRSTKTAVLMLTSDGLYACLDGGNVVNLTQDRMLFPQAVRVNSLFRSQDGVNQYIGVADSAGSPSSNTRIGDYVDAEIRRFQGA